MLKRFVTFAGCAAFFVLGCESDKTITQPLPGTALVRFINATQRDTIDVATAGAVSTATDSLVFGQVTGCLTVNATTPAISFRRTGTTADLASFTPSFTAAHKYWVVATTGANGPQFVTIDQAFTATAPATDNGIIGLNAVTTGTQNFDLHVTTPGATLSTTTVKIANLAPGVASAFANNTIPFNTATPPVAQPQQLQFTNTGTTTVARNAGNTTMVPTVSTLAIVGPGTAAAPATLRSIINGGC